MPRLIQLKNGDWIDPRAVRQIRAIDGHDGTLGGWYPPRLVVHWGEAEGSSLVEYPTFDAACRARDELAGQVMGAGSAP